MRTIRDFLVGVGYLGRGLALWARDPRLLVLGVIPALISAAIAITGYVLLFSNLGDIVGALDGFADDWAAGWRSVARFLIGALVVGSALMLGTLLFTALTLAIGDPFYEKISERVEDMHGGVRDEVEVSFARSLSRSIVDSARLIGASVLIGVPLFVAGFIPLVGQTVVPALGAITGGWFLTVELVGVPFQRRGLRIQDRRRVLRARRPVAIGFGAATFVLFLIPLGAVLVMPSAVAGATLLAREALGEGAPRADESSELPTITGGRTEAGA